MSVGGDDEPSFDPRSWARPRPEPEVEPTPEAEPPPPRVSVDRRLLLMAGGGGLLVATAGGWAFTHRRKAPPAVAAAGAVAPVVGAVRRSLVIDKIGDLPDALVGAGLPASVAGEVTRAAQNALGSADGPLRVILSLGQARPDFLQMELRHPDGSGVVVRPGASGVTAAPLASDLKVKIKVIRGEMDANSFYSSAVAAGVTDSLISDFANAFAFDFDFQREIRPGDIFEAAFEQRVSGTGEAVGAERLVYASLQTAAKSRAFYRHQPSGEASPAWFDGNGSSIVRSLMRTPVEGARITSTFGPRMHPVLGYTRMHKGTDFATPVGTTVFASGDGVIDFVGVHGGHGNYMSVRHSPTLQTAYAHLSAYGPGMTVGASVRQGQAIALSGNTGLSSGPHLHYEVIVNGEQVDPMTFETTSGRNLTGAALAAFRQERDRIDALRAAQNG